MGAGAEASSCPMQMLSDLSRCDIVLRRKLSFSQLFQRVVQGKWPWNGIEPPNGDVGGASRTRNSAVVGNVLQLHQMWGSSRVRLEGQFRCWPTEPTKTSTSPVSSSPPSPHLHPINCPSTQTISQIANHVSPSIQRVRLHAPLFDGEALAASLGEHNTQGNQSACPRDFAIPGGRGSGAFLDDRKHRRGGYDADGGAVRGAEG